MLKLKPMVGLLISATSLGSAFVVGDYIKKDQIPPQTCLLFMVETIDLGANYKVTTTNKFCSATLIDHDLIATARHCLNAERLKTTKVMCGESAGKSELSDLVQVLAQTSDEEDLMLVSLKTPMKTAPMPVISAGEYAKLKSGAIKPTCGAFGYGRDNNGASGAIHGVYLKRGEYGFEGNEVKLTQKTKFSRERSVVDHGDSGGTFACKIDETWKLVGVHSYVSTPVIGPLAGIQSEGTSKKFDLTVKDRIASKLELESTKRWNTMVAKKAAGATIAQVKKDFGASLSEIHSLGYSDKDIVASGYKPKELLSMNWTRARLETAGFTMRELAPLFLPQYPRFIEATKPQVEPNTYTVHYYGTDASAHAAPCAIVYENDALSGYDAAGKPAGKFSKFVAAETEVLKKSPECLNLSATVDAIKREGFNLHDLHAAGMKAVTLSKLGYTYEELLEVGITFSELRDIGASAGELHALGVTPADLLMIGYTAEELLGLKLVTQKDLHEMSASFSLQSPKVYIQSKLVSAHEINLNSSHWKYGGHYGIRVMLREYLDAKNKQAFESADIAWIKEAIETLERGFSHEGCSISKTDRRFKIEPKYDVFTPKVYRAFWNQDRAIKKLLRSDCVLQ